MLSKSFDARVANSEQLPLSRCTCGECDNTFFVAVIEENEPRYCPYCGFKFLRFVTAEGKEQTFQGEE